MVRLTIHLDPALSIALQMLAEHELRLPQAEAVVIIQRELERRGILPVRQLGTDTLLPLAREITSRERVP